MKIKKIEKMSRIMAEMVNTKFFFIGIIKGSRLVT
jgi:hypothetical protein